MLRPEFVERKLQLITDDLGRLAVFREVSYDALVSDAVKLAAVERFLERIILRAVDINQHLVASLAIVNERSTTRLLYRETFVKLADLGVYSSEFGERIAPSAGLRNILVHEYNDVDHRILHASIASALEQYAAYVVFVREYLNRRQS